MSQTISDLQTPPFVPPSAVDNADALPDLMSYRRIVVATDFANAPQSSKTAWSLLRYRRDDIVAVLDPELPFATAGDAFGHGGSIPIVRSFDEVATPDALFIGVSPAGGRLPRPLRSAIAASIREGIDVVAGLHDFLRDDDEFSLAAAASGSRLIDVRRNSERTTATGASFRPGCLRIHTVGHDCSVGKMVASAEIDLALRRRGVDSKFLATGQTGIMISGAGIPIDCVVSDFVNGAAERLVLEHDEHDVLVIEGQGSAVHPAYSGVTVGLLHGAAPDGLILCYEAGRQRMKGLEHIKIPPLEKFVSLYETLATFRNPCRVIGIAMNSRRLDSDAADIERERVSAELGLPVCDVCRDGADLLADAILSLRESVIR
ncbi:DUF1611 domain-containing protein [Stratiformator vulcanicus]|uniref:DUF1611 domain-containing protein n=1 Tax=Stratiformator vulcanicus TaxID=2527980 RepID=A0A517QWV7_9PLAN|nr:DUF1611 domain-containing protein [Stratiformator vulcanicus]QDT36077.1 hypothetical protein Pan189_04320 [Stratiformator vulcanicus]